MKIVFFTLSPNGLYSSLIDKLEEKGHSIVIVSPTYNGKNEFLNINQNRKILYFKSLPLTNVGIIKKGIADILFPYFCRLSVKKYIGRYQPDLIISTTPTLGFGKSISFLKNNNLKCKHYLVLRDIWPEAFKLFDFDTKFPLVYKWYRKQEKYLYNTADIIGCMSEGNIEFVNKSNPEIGIDKLKLLPNWADVEELNSIDESIRTKYKLDDKIVFIYGGNMSVPQGLDNILNLAERQIRRDNILFLLIGKGTELERIKKLAKEKALTNMEFLDYLPKKDYESLLRISDVGLISLNKKLKTPSIPSKTLSYWNLEKPIFAIIDSVTDYGINIIDKSQSGLWELSTEINKIDEKFDIICRDGILRKKMGKNGRIYMTENCTTELIYNKIMQHLYE